MSGQEIGHCGDGKCMNQVCTCGCEGCLREEEQAQKSIDNALAISKSIGEAT